MLADPVSEKAILSCLFNAGRNTYIEVADLIGHPKSFTVRYNEVFYTCLQHAFDKLEIERPDIATIYTAAKDLGLERTVNDPKCEEHISQVIEFNTDPGNAKKFAAKVRKLYIKRTIIKELESATEELENSGDKKVSEMLAIVESKVFGLSTVLSAGDTGPVVLKNVAKTYLEEKENNPVEQVGISTGFPRWDASIGGGLRPGSISVIGARAKSFKSGIALNMGINVAALNIPVLYLDTELQDFEQIPRAIASLSGLEIKDVETGAFGKNPSKRRKAWEAQAKLNEFFFHQNIARMPFDEQLFTMRQWIYKVPKVGLNGKVAAPCMIVYDYIKLMDTEGLKDLQETQLLGFRLTTMHDFAVKHNIPILTFVQLNRDGINREDTSVAAASDRILWFCSNFSILKEKSQEEIDKEMNHGIKDAGNFKLKPLACRHGEGLAKNDYINLKIKKSSFQLREGLLNSETLKNSALVANVEDEQLIEF